MNVTRVGEVSAKKSKWESESERECARGFVLNGAFPRYRSLAFSCSDVAAGRSQPVKNPVPRMTRCKENSDLCHDKEVR